MLHLLIKLRFLSHSLQIEWLVWRTMIDDLVTDVRKANALGKALYTDMYLYEILSVW